MSAHQEPDSQAGVRRYVLTGAPGAGKTTVLRALRDRGFAVVGEAATDVITAGQHQGVAQPWRAPDSLAFERLHEEVYREHGLEIVDVPPGAVTERAAFVAASLTRPAAYPRTD
jgi:predicted ATPase